MSKAVAILCVWTGMRTKVTQVRDAVQLSVMGACSTSRSFSIAQMYQVGKFNTGGHSAAVSHMECERGWVLRN